MTTELTFSSVLLPFPKWRRLVDETARLDMPLARRLVLLRITWEESYLTDAQLQTRVKDLLGLDCFGDRVEEALADDIEAVRQAFDAAGHRLVYAIALVALLVCFVLVMVYRSSSSSSTAGAPAGGVSTSAPIAVAPHGVTSTIASTVTLIPGMTDTLAVTPTVIQAVTPTPGVTVTLVVTSQATPSPGFTVISRSVADTNAVMAATKDGEPIILTTEVLTERVRLDSGEITWIAPHYRVRVSRAGSVTYLNWRLPGWNEGCTIEMECADWIYSTFATRAKSDFPNGPSRLVDLDGDGEPEILTMWPLDGSGDIWSFHVHRWDGNQYQLLAEASEQRLTAETQDLNGDGRPELIVRFYASPHRFHIPWVDVYALSGDQLVLVNSRYPQFYEELLAEYEVRIPEYTALATALASDGPSDETIEAMKELERRKEMARALVE